MARAHRKPQQAAGDIVERPPWLIPLLITCGVIAFAALFLWYYVGPSAEELLGRAPEATASAELVQVRIGDVAMAVPASYTRYASTRQGGAFERLDLHALLPELDPFTPSTRVEFDRSDPLSPVLHMRIEQTTSVLAAQRRLELIYLPAATDPEGEPGPYGLRHYVFGDDTGLRGQDMYVGDGPAGAPAILVCTRTAPLVWCRRDILLSETVVLRYRYKRAHLEQWKQIDNQALALIASFRAQAAAKGLRPQPGG